MLVVRNPTTRCPAPPSGLRPLSAPPPPPPHPPTPSCPALSRVRPSSHRHPVHSPSFLMLGSYSRCAARASLSHPSSPPIAPSLSRFLNAARSSLLCSLRPACFSLFPSAVIPSLSNARALSKKKRRGLRSIFITQTGRPSGAHKKCLFTYGDWSATGFGGNAEPLSLARRPSRPAPRRRRLFPARVLRFSSRPPRALSCAPLSLSPFPPFFFDAGKKCAPPVDWSRGQMT